MPKQSDADVIREVDARIDQALAHNRRQELTIIIVLILLFLSGLVLIIWAALSGRWGLLVPGGILQITIVLPIQRLIRLRENNMRLQILPQLMKLADTDQAKVLDAKLVNRLIDQV